jgi:hypothetical protein
MSDTPKTERTPEEQEAAERRMTSPGIGCIGDEVIWDGEAEFFGMDPLVFYPEPEDLKNIDHPETTEDAARTRRKPR